MCHFIVPQYFLLVREQSKPVESRVHTFNCSCTFKKENVTLHFMQTFFVLLMNAFVLRILFTLNVILQILKNITFISHKNIFSAYFSNLYIQLRGLKYN